MLTPDYLDGIADPILSLYRSYEDSIIRDIVRRIVKMGAPTPTSAWQLQRLIESGAVYDNVLREIAKLTGKSEAELKRLFRQAGVRSMRFDDSIYRQAGMSPIPLNLSPAMAQVLKIGLERTNNLMRNLTQTTAFSAQQSFISAADLAYQQVVTGSMSYDQAIRQAIKSVGASGLEIVYPSGKRDKLDVAIRRAVLTGVSQTAGRLQEQRADEIGQDLVQTSLHVGARPEHQEWQGKIFSRSGTHPNYPDFVASTGYGTVTGLHGVNCRHSYYPFFEGISKDAYDKATRDEAENKTVTYNGKQISAYEASQIQRAYERRVRYFKRQELALQTAKLEHIKETAKIREYQARLRDLIKQTGRNREYVREQI
jgi:hypothetical protein